MAGAASELLEKLFALRCHGAFGAAAREPVLKGSRLHRRNPTDHTRMLGPAIFGAEDVIAAGLGGGEPDVIVMTRNHVVLDAEGRDEEAVDDVFRRHGEADLAADGYMNFV